MNGSGSQESTNKLDKKLLKLVHVMTRYTILVSISVCSSFVISFLCWGALDIDSGLTLNTDTLINCICLYFQFKFAHGDYKFCCRSCHNRIEKYFVGKILENEVDLDQIELL